MHQSSEDRNADSQLHEVRVSWFCSTAGLILKFESGEGKWNPGVWFAVRGMWHVGLSRCCWRFISGNVPHEKARKPGSVELGDDDKKCSFSTQGYAERYFLKELSAAEHDA